MRSLRSLPRRLPQLARAPRRNLSTARLSDLELENARLREEIARLRQPTRPTGEGTLFVGAKSSYTTSMDFWYPHVDNVPAAMPCFRIMDDLGRVVPGAEAHVPALSREHALACMHTMLRVNEFDKIFLDAQRQGRISFYLTGRGEEGATVGSAAALQPDDWVLPQYRELGVFFWRGFTFQEVANQLCATAHDPAHGRQLPLHIGSKERCILYVKSTLATQAPHATGVALHMKRTRQPRISIAYFGEGTASHGDIPSALNIAAVHGSPMIFFCRNNGYAISTNAKDQYRSDGIAPRGPAFGLPTIRIDGNDLLAVVAATKKARDICLHEGRPCLIEAMTYRIGAHSTSDDDTKYRTRDAPVEVWGPLIASLISTEHATLRSRCGDPADGR